MTNLVLLMPPQLLAEAQVCSFFCVFFFLSTKMLIGDPQRVFLYCEQFNPHSVCLFVYAAEEH